MQIDWVGSMHQEQPKTLADETCHGQRRVEMAG